MQNASLIWLGKLHKMYVGWCIPVIQMLVKVRYKYCGWVQGQLGVEVNQEVYVVVMDVYKRTVQYHDRISACKERDSRNLPPMEDKLTVDSCWRRESQCSSGMWSLVSCSYSSEWPNIQAHTGGTKWIQWLNFKKSTLNREREGVGRHSIGGTERDWVGYRFDLNAFIYLDILK